MMVFSVLFAGDVRQPLASHAITVRYEGPVVTSLNWVCGLDIALHSIFSTSHKVPYSSGFLGLDRAPLSELFLGTPAPWFDELTSDENLFNAAHTPLQRFDRAMLLGTGRAGSVASHYRRFGAKSRAQFWEGYCDRWCVQSLNPDLAGHLDHHVLYHGIFFSIAELRSLATYFGKACDTLGLWS